MLRIQTKSFQELSTNEVYAILQLRSEVFVVEQDCIYQDIDGKDQKALHVIGVKEGRIVAYTRIFRPGDYHKEASIGRVVVKDSERDHGYGADIIRASVDAIKDYFLSTVIHISAQTYLKKFYNSLGFKEIGEAYLEDGIPHIGMVKKLKT